MGVLFGNPNPEWGWTHHSPGCQPGVRDEWNVLQPQRGWTSLMFVLIYELTIFKFRPLEMGWFISKNFNHYPTLSLRHQYMMKSLLCGNCMFLSACSSFYRCKMLKPSAIRLSVSALPAPGPFLLLQQMTPGFLISGYSGMGITGMVRLHRIRMLHRVLFRWSTMCMIHSAPAAIPARRALRCFLPPFAMPPFTAIMIRLIIAMVFIVLQIPHLHLPR